MRVLANYALREGERPRLVDLDVGQNTLTVPGTISETRLIPKCMDIELGFMLGNPLVYYYGHTNVAVNPEHVRSLQRELASAVKCRLAADTQVNASGCIIRTSGWVKDIGYDLLEEAIQAFEVHTVLVLGDYQLNYRLETFQDHQRSANRFSVIHLEQPNGVVALDRKYLVNRRAHRIEDYFYGPSSFVQPLPLFYPETMECTMDAVEFFQVRGKRRLACCGDSTATPDRPVVTRREVSRSMANTLVAVMSCDPLATVPCDHSWLLVAPVCCFVIVKDVRPRDNVISLLVPNTGPLPSKYLLTGSITGLITR